MPSPEVAAFLSRINALPSGAGVSLDEALQPSLEDEAELRKLYATDKKNDRLTDNHVGLFDLYAAPPSLRIIRARVVKDDQDLSAKYVMPLSNEARRPEGSPSVVANIDEFKKNWSIFTEGSLSQLVDWSNVVAAGGSVLACLTPLADKDKTSKRAIRKFYHSNAYPSSDVDLFLYGMNPEQAEAKIKVIYEAVRDSVPWDVTCIRTKHAISISSQYPYRSVQIILRLYQSFAEILAGFDIDAPCCAYDGDRVWVNPRSAVALMRQCNTVDITRRSPSYEIRLAKYSQRGFEVFVPNLDRSEVDPTIYERSIARMEGLARLLVLEKLHDGDRRSAFLEGRRQLRGRRNVNSRGSSNKKHYKGDLKKDDDILGLELNDYDVARLHIPYGPGWDARRIEKLVYQTDLGMNSTFNPKNKGRRLHRHPAFFGTIEECLEDCCEHCPKPIDEDEKTLQTKEDDMYIRGRIRFIEENPGRQSMSGSFNPIDDGEWSEQVYIKPTEQLFAAIAIHDRATVQKLLAEGIDINQRDHVGRTSLHVAILSKAAEIACDLIDSGARISARLADGRNPLHLASQFDMENVIKKLIEKNAVNVEEAKKKKDEGGDDEMYDTPEKHSSEDDWSSHDDEDVNMDDEDINMDDEDVNMDDEDEDGDGDDEGDDDDDDGDVDGGRKKKKKGAKTDNATANPARTGDIPEENDDQPDIIDINESDWDVGFSALAYAVLFASLSTLSTLIARGADYKLASKSDVPLHPLTLTVVREDEDEACRIAEHLLKVGATSTTADSQMSTIFHVAVRSGRTKLVETILRCDQYASTVINFPAFTGNNNVIFPVVTAISNRHYAIVALLLANGAKLDLEEKDITTSLDAAKPEVRRRVGGYGDTKNYLHYTYQPIETALRIHDDFVTLLIRLGATVDVGVIDSLDNYSSPQGRRTIKEYVRWSILALLYEMQEKEKVLVEKPEALEERKHPGWKGFFWRYQDSLIDLELKKDGEEEKKARDRKEALERLKEVKDLFVDVGNALKTRRAKDWKAVYPALESTAVAFEPPKTSHHSASTSQITHRFWFLSDSYNSTSVPEHLFAAYEELFEACYMGDNEKIQRLCLPIEGQNIATPGVPNPLNISVKMTPSNSGSYDPTGYTTLYAAIAGRKWSTAKLILAIATAQYKPEDEDDKFKFDILDEMSEGTDDDNDSMASDDTETHRKEIKFIDIATRPSAVESDVHPKKMLQNMMVGWRKPKSPELKGPDSGSATLLELAIINHDLEAFVRIADLYETLPQPLEIPSSILDTILLHDQPDILDEFIRRTGGGIDVADARTKAGFKEGEMEIQEATNDKNKLYLGLNVHGKKRTDLARKNDPNASNANDHGFVPLVWKAAQQSAKDVLSYLSSNRPFEAYKLFASTHASSRAIWFRRMLSRNAGAQDELEKRLSGWLGWSINQIGETPLTAAILSKDFETINVLAKVNPALMKTSIQTKIKFVDMNPLLLAVSVNCDTKIIDYLLSRNISATDRDSTKGFNIYHRLCDMNNGKLLEHLLQKLPRNVNEALLVQQSYKRMNTPLHLAVKKGSKHVVSILLAYTTSNVLIRDIDAQTPLHCAVKRAFAEITQTLLSASPFSYQALFMEDSVGNLPSEIINLEMLFKTLWDQANRYSPSVLSLNRVDTDPNRFDDPETMEKNIEELKAVIDQLADKKPAKGLKIPVVAKWIQETEQNVKLAKERVISHKLKDEEERKAELAKNGPQYASDVWNCKKTLAVVRKAMKDNSSSANVNSRQLIHLLDVQKSVNESLSVVNDEESDDDDDYHRRSKWKPLHDDDQLEESEDTAKKLSLAWRFVGGIKPDSN